MSKTVTPHRAMEMRKYGETFGYPTITKLRRRTALDNAAFALALTTTTEEFRQLKMWWDYGLRSKSINPEDMYSANIALKHHITAHRRNLP